MPHSEFDTLLRFFKALADETRLRLLGLLAGSERSVEELAALLGLKAPTVSHHLARLKDLGVVRMRAEGTVHLYALDADGLRAMSTLVLTPERMASLVSHDAASDADGWDAYERKVLRDFFDGARLTEIPAQRKKRSVVLRWLATRFEPGRAYPEKEVNALLARHHPDTASLRRELVGEHLLTRESGIYRRVEG